MNQGIDNAIGTHGITEDRRKHRYRRSIRNDEHPNLDRHPTSHSDRIETESLYFQPFYKF